MMKAGFLQFQPQLGDLNANIARIGELLDHASDADLMVLPELASSGYHFESREQALELAEETHKSIYVDFLVSQAKKHNLFLVSGINERDKDKLYNSSVLVSANGLLGKYRKMHLFMNEKNNFEPGNSGLPVFDLGICKAGMLICFDWIFPEVWRILSLKGADVICHPSNLLLPYAQQAVPVHGLMNRTFNITANRTGTERGITFTGQSIISDPTGKVLKKASADKDEIMIAELDLNLARNKRITPANHVFDDRRPEEYGFLVEKETTDWND
jgi:predicted amidohydrolase